MHILYAMRNEVLVYVDDVENGLKSNCYCSACGEKLVAKNGGNKKIHHFAHYSGADCSRGYETSIHLLSKKILEESKVILVPELTLQYDYSSFKMPIIESNVFKFENVEAEKKYNDIIPDLTCYNKDGVGLFIEIKVTHGIDEEKHKKLMEYNIPVLEVDLSNVDREIDELILRDILHNEVSSKEWVFHNQLLEYDAKLKSIAKPKELVERGFASHYDDCPIDVNNFKGVSYANFTNDCLGCDYFVCIEGNEVCCVGKLKVKSIEEIDKFYNEYIKDPTLFEHKPSKFHDCYNLAELWKMNDNKPFYAKNTSNEIMVKIDVNPVDHWEKYNGKCYGLVNPQKKYCKSAEIYNSRSKIWKLIKL